MASYAVRDGVEPWRRRLYLPAYQIAAAARYSGAHANTIASWFKPSGDRVPTLYGRETGSDLSYMELVEVAFVASMRRLGVPLRNVRRAREYLSSEFEEEYPFAAIRFKSDGQRILTQLADFEPGADAEKLVSAGEGGQIIWEPMIAGRFEEFDYDHGLAVRWHPAGRESPVLIDPQVAFGAPIVSGVPTWAIRGRWDAGETIDDIVEDFDVEPSFVHEALKFEGVQDASAVTH